MCLLSCVCELACRRRGHVWSLGGGRAQNTRKKHNWKAAHCSKQAFVVNHGAWGREAPSAMYRWTHQSYSSCNGFQWWPKLRVKSLHQNPKCFNYCVTQYTILLLLHISSAVCNAVFCHFSFLQWLMIETPMGDKWFCCWPWITFSGDFFLITFCD